MRKCSIGFEWYEWALYSITNSLVALMSDAELPSFILVFKYLNVYAPHHVHYIELSIIDFITYLELAHILQICY
jgi:hypothetical protein